MIVQPLRTTNFHGNGRMGETNLPIIGSVCFSFQPVVLKTTRVWSMTHGVKIILIALRKFSIVTKFKFSLRFPRATYYWPKRTVKLYTAEFYEYAAATGVCKSSYYYI